MTEPKGCALIADAPVSRLPRLEVAALQVLAMGPSSQHTRRVWIFLLHYMSPRVAQSGQHVSAIGGKANIDQPGS